MNSTHFNGLTKGLANDVDLLGGSLGKMKITRNTDKYGYLTGSAASLKGSTTDSAYESYGGSMNGSLDGESFGYLNGHGSMMNGDMNGYGKHGGDNLKSDENNEDDYGEYGDHFSQDFLGGSSQNGLKEIEEESPVGGACCELPIDSIPEIETVVEKPVVIDEQKQRRESARERARKASRDLKREQNDTSGGGRRSLKREHIVIKWILRVTHKDKDSSIDFADWIRDGKILTLVMTTLCFNSVENDPFTNLGCSPEEKRIKEVREQILDYGVDKKYIFTVDDILLKKNTPKVIRCLEEVAKLSKQETHIKYDTLLNNKLYT